MGPEDYAADYLDAKKSVRREKEIAQKLNGSSVSVFRQHRDERCMPWSYTSKNFEAELPDRLWRN